MAVFEVRFKVTDHFADDSGYDSFEEATRVSADDEAGAWKEFHSAMCGTSYEIVDLFEVK